MTNNDYLQSTGQILHLIQIFVAVLNRVVSTALEAGSVSEAKKCQDHTNRNLDRTRG